MNMNPSDPMKIVPNNLFWKIASYPRTIFGVYYDAKHCNRFAQRLASEEFLRNSKSNEMKLTLSSFCKIGMTLITSEECFGSLMLVVPPKLS